jgi:hypothetical protein
MVIVTGPLSSLVEKGELVPGYQYLATSLACTNLFKDPVHAAEAVADLRKLQIKLTGRGDLHQPLRQEARDLDCETRCGYTEAILHEQAGEMRNTDMFVLDQISLGISNSVVEAALAILLIVANARRSGSAGELSRERLVHEEDSRMGCSQALKTLLQDRRERSQLGQGALAYGRGN